MSTYPDEVFDEMMERCDTVLTMTHEPDQLAGDVTLGAIIRTSDEGFMTVECGQSADGSGFVSVRRFDRFGEQIAIDIVEVDGSVLVTG